MYVNGNFGNAGSARNRGLENATGEWVVFWDSDDKAFPEATLEIIKSFNNHKIKVTSFAVRKSLESQQTLTSNVSLRTVVANPGIWRFIFPTKSIKSIKFPSITIGEDLSFIIASQVFDLPYELIDILTYEYQISDFQTTNNLENLYHHKVMIDKLLELITHIKPKSFVPYGILIRQLISILMNSRGREIIFCISKYFYVLRRNGIRSALPLLIGLATAITPGVV
jgi:glycosyltransferase involved in cell wall biosynthesis